MVNNIVVRIFQFLYIYLVVPTGAGICTIGGGALGGLP